MSSAVLMPPATDPLDVETPKGFELINGQLVEKPTSKDASRIATRVLGRLYQHCQTTSIGEPLNGDTAFRCFPNRPRHCRKPDASFMTAERLLEAGTGPGDFIIPPDLAVEVISPNEPASRLNGKINDYRSVGVPIIWVIDPDNRLAHVYTKESIRIVREDEFLEGGDVVPGFRVRLGDVLLPATAREET